MRYPRVTEKPGRRESTEHDPFIDGLETQRPELVERLLTPKPPAPRRPRPPRGRRSVD